MESLSKQANKYDPLLIFLISSGCLLVIHLYAFCKIWSVVEHGVECYFRSIVF